MGYDAPSKIQETLLRINDGRRSQEICSTTYQQPSNFKVSCILKSLTLFLFNLIVVLFRLPRQEETLHNIKQRYVICDNKYRKFEVISNIYGVLTIAQTTIFCRVSS